MHIKKIDVRNFKRFTALTIDQIPNTAKLIVVTGPNGCGKSSLFDAFRTWHAVKGAVFNFHGDPIYMMKQGSVPVSWAHHTQIEFHEGGPAAGQDVRKIFYIRSAYRNEPDFTMTNLNNVGPALDSKRRIAKLIDNDANVSDNYQRLVSASVAGLYDGKRDFLKVSELREEFIGKIRVSMSKVFENLVLKGPGDPLRNGSFYFDKGMSTDFHYKNLSSGEKAAFDLLLDLIVKSLEYDDTIYCIDEPEIHMHTRLQGKLLHEFYHLIPDNSQLWINTHSIGMMRKAKDLHAANPNSVIFIDFSEKDFDSNVELTPTVPSREFWLKMLGVALDDLANLVAPKEIVLCEGKSSGKKSAFDAHCYKIIFSYEFPETDFLSVGNHDDVTTGRLEMDKAIQTLAKGTKVIKLIDRDDRSAQEIEQFKKEGVRVLSLRHLESYILDDEVLTLLCRKENQPDKIDDILQAKRQAIQQITIQGKPTDDIKSAAGLIYVEIKRILSLTQCGNSADTFQRDTLVPLITVETRIYKQLKKDIFGT